MIGLGGKPVERETFDCIALEKYSGSKSRLRSQRGKSGRAAFDGAILGLSGLLNKGVFDGGVESLLSSGCSRSSSQAMSLSNRGLSREHTSHGTDVRSTIDHKSWPNMGGLGTP